MRIRTQLPQIAALVACAAAPSVTFAWNDHGHMVAACIAYKQLEPAKQKELVEVLKGNSKVWDMITAKIPAGTKDADRDRFAFMLAATWPDMVRDKQSPMAAEHRAAWHFINLPVNRDDQKGKEPVIDWKPTHKTAQNVVEALMLCEHDLKDAAVPKEQKSIRLCWMLHLIGDIHQPLHAVALYSDRYARGDEGGNRIWVLPRDGQKKKLHAFWDDALGSSESLSNAEDAASDIVKDPFRTKTAMKESIRKDRYEEWARESKVIAEEKVYLKGKFPKADAHATELKPEPLPTGYDHEASETAKARVALAGYRMGEKLKLLGK